MEWLRELIARFWKLLPRLVIVNPNEQAVLVRCGKVRKMVGPGIHFLLPIVDEAHPIIVISQVVDLSDIAVPAKEGKTLAASATIEYHIRDAEAALFEIYDYDKAIRVKGAACLTRALYRKTWNNGDLDLDTIEIDVVKDLSNQVKEWGIEVDECILNKLNETVAVDLTLHQVDQSGSNGLFIGSNGEGE